MIVLLIQNNVCDQKGDDDLTTSPLSSLRPSVVKQYIFYIIDNEYF